MSATGPGLRSRAPGRRSGDLHVHGQVGRQAVVGLVAAQVARATSAWSLSRGRCGCSEGWSWRRPPADAAGSVPVGDHVGGLARVTADSAPGGLNLRRWPGSWRLVPGSSLGGDGPTAGDGGGGAGAAAAVAVAVAVASLAGGPARRRWWSGDRAWTRRPWAPRRRRRCGRSSSRRSSASQPAVDLRGRSPARSG